MPNTETVSKTGPGPVSTGAARACVAAVLLLVAGQVLATAAEPRELVNDVVSRVMDRVAALPDAETSAPAAQAVFEEEISPHLDFATITGWLAGQRWKTLEACERREMLALVRSHIVRVYAAMLAGGGDTTIEVAPEATVRKRSAKVPARITTGSGQDFDIEFRLLRATDEWKLVDLAVGGLSFARSLRAELSPVFEAGGIAALKAYFDKHASP